MASYTILTSRQQEIGLKFSYDHYADKTVYDTQQKWFQFQISQLVTNPMFAQQQAASVKSFDDSFKTIPEAEQPAASAEIETVITSHGGTVVPPHSVGSVVTVPQPTPPEPSAMGWLPKDLPPLPEPTPVSWPPPLPPVWAGPNAGPRPNGPTIPPEGFELPEEKK